MGCKGKKFSTKCLLNNINIMKHMKRIGLLILTLFLCVLVSAQTHMKFMGIPLDGTIDVFAQKLKAKGITYDADISKKLSPGAKLYTGLFMGENAQFMVMFNAKSRIVYSVVVELSYSTLELAKTPFCAIAEGLRNKYSNVSIEKIENDDDEAIGLSFNILDTKTNERLGIVRQLLSEQEGDGYMNPHWNIRLFYIDVDNALKNEKINNDDL